MDVITITFLLLAAHAVCDYPLQGDFLAQGKGSFAKPHFGIPWWHCLTAHALIHGGAVALITQCVWLGIIETALHWVIDYEKCRGSFGINTDQALHVACKLAFVVIVAMGVTS